MPQILLLHPCGTIDEPHYHRHNLNTLAVGLYLIINVVTDRYNIFKEFQGNIPLIGVIVVLGIALFGFMIFTFLSSIHSGLEMRKRSFLRFKFEDEYVASLENKAKVFSYSIGVFCLFAAIVLTDNDRYFSVLATISVSDFSRIVLGCMSCAYALPILSSYWKNDE
ncbi:hypothetical protein [Undibacterium danionis]|uniref:Uncharacterized protein n=1 Tax=Undibacterium danionis TaxID=1812100 RepID=A0ABV6IAT3_9BURK